MQKKYFIDTFRDDNRWHFGSIIWPETDAVQRAGELQAEHPTWIVELNLVDSNSL